MKRFLAIVLSLSMILVVCLMAGCGDDPAETTGASSTTNTTAGSGSDNTSGTDTPGETTGSTDGTSDTTESTPDTTAEPDGYSKPYGFENVDFGGATFTIAADDGVADGWEAAKEVYSDGTDTISVAVRLRNDTMAKLYNCTIQVQAVSDPGSLAQADITGGQENIQLYTVKYGGKATAEAGQVYNLYNLGINFENTWWDQNFVDTYSIKKTDGTMTLYTIIGDFALSSFSATHAIMVNKTVLENSPITDNIYDLVRNKEWTMDKFVEMIIASAQDTSGNSEYHYSEGDILGWVRTAHAAHGLHVASGLSIIENNDGALSLSVTNNASAWNDVIDTAITVWNTTGAETLGYTDVQTAMEGARTLFASEVLDVLERMKDTEGVSVGLVPYPLYSETQENYAHYVDNHFYAYAVPTSVSDITRMGQFLEVYGFHSKYLVRPAWIEAYSYEYCNDADSAEMLDIILDTRTYDPGYLWWAGNEGYFSGFITDGTNNVTRWADRNAATIANDIQTTVEKISSHEA